jgi:hypothetical protein
MSCEPFWLHQLEFYGIGFAFGFVVSRLLWWALRRR